jgi:ketosteroid isomerase-like protein
MARELDSRVRIPDPQYKSTENVAVDKKQSELALTRLERRFMKATRERDAEFLERHLGEEFTLTTGRPGAEVRVRSEWLEITRESYVIDSFDFEELDVRVYGHVAVVSSRYRQVAHMGELDRNGRYVMTDVWIRRKGRWQLVCRHATALAAPPGDRG